MGRSLINYYFCYSFRMEECVAGSIGDKGHQGGLQNAAETDKGQNIFVARRDFVLVIFVLKNLYLRIDHTLNCDFKNHIRKYLSIFWFSSAEKIGVYCT